MNKIKMFLLLVTYSVLPFVVGGLFIFQKAGSIIISKQKIIKKNQKSLLILKDWIKKKQQNKNIIDFLKMNNYRSIAIYGLSDIGKLLAEELSRCAKISYVIDRRNISAEYPVYKIEDDLPDVDMLIITVIGEFEEIEESIKGKLKCPIYSIEDIIYFMN